jgi:hypothetical protein
VCQKPALTKIRKTITKIIYRPSRKGTHKFGARDIAFPWLLVLTIIDSPQEKSSCGSVTNEHTYIVCGLSIFLQSYVWVTHNDQYFSAVSYIFLSFSTS